MILKMYVDVEDLEDHINTLDDNEFSTILETLEEITINIDPQDGKVSKIELSNGQEMVS